MNAAHDDDYLTVAEIAALLKVNPQTVRNWISRDELRAVRVSAVAAHDSSPMTRSWTP
jgi:uncharacterized protein YjcR